MPARLADAIQRGRVCNQDVMFGIDCLETNDWPIDEVRQRLTIAWNDRNVCFPGVWDLEGLATYLSDQGNQKKNGTLLSPGKLSRLKCLLSFSWIYTRMPLLAMMISAMR